MNFEKIQNDETVKTVRFTDLKKELIDIDFIFRETNQYFGKLLIELGLPISFDFSKRDNKRLYTHSFLKIFMDFIQHRNTEYVPFFFSDTLTKDTFKNSLVKKIKRYFGFLIFEDVQDLSTFIAKIEINDSRYLPLLEIFLQTEKKPKRFKEIKKYLDKEGLKFMSDIYFNDFYNKMLIYV